MPLAHWQHETLQRQLQVHEKRIAMLRDHLETVESKVKRDPNYKARSAERKARARDVIEREIRVHEHLLELGRDPKVIKALDEVATNRDFAREAARDPRKAARERGIELPPNMLLDLDVERDGAQLRITYYEELFPFTATWNSKTGFAPPPASRRKGN